MNTGWVYILSNPSIPDKVKVGWTQGRPELRARELQSTGVPTAFKVETALLFSNQADQIERKAHELLSDMRVSSAREFFQCKPLHALKKVLEAAEILGESVRDTDPILVTEEELRAIREREEQERLQQEKKRLQKLRILEQESAERIKKEKELETWRKAYERLLLEHRTDCWNPQRKGPFPSFEEWYSEMKRRMHEKERFQWEFKKPG